MSIDLTLFEFVSKFHELKDPMHDASHIHRLRFIAKQISKLVGVPVENVNYALFFHGLDPDQRDQLATFMQSYGFDEDASNYYIYLESFTSKRAHPITDEEKLIHDAHVLEGGPYFHFIKSLITGSHRDQSLEFTINFYEHRVSKDLKCHFPQTQLMLLELQKQAESMISSLREFLPNELNFPQ